jgi:hypothetical protein
MTLTNLDEFYMLIPKINMISAQVQNWLSTFGGPKWPIWAKIGPKLLKIAKN